MSFTPCQATALRLLVFDTVRQSLAARSYCCRAKSASRARSLRPVDSVLVVDCTWLVSWSMNAFDSLALMLASPSVSMALNSAVMASCSAVLVPPARRSAAETLPSSLVSRGS